MACNTREENAADLAREEQEKQTKRKFTVILTRSTVRHARAIVEVEATDWIFDDEDTDMGDIESIEVQDDQGGSTSWDVDEDTEED